MGWRGEGADAGRLAGAACPNRAVKGEGARAARPAAAPRRVRDGPRPRPGIPVRSRSRSQRPGEYGPALRGTGRPVDGSGGEARSRPGPKDRGTMDRPGQRLSRRGPSDRGRRHGRGKNRTAWGAWGGRVARRSRRYRRTGAPGGAPVFVLPGRRDRRRTGRGGADARLRSTAPGRWRRSSPGDPRGRGVSPRPEASRTPGTQPGRRRLLIPRAAATPPAGRIRAPARPRSRPGARPMGRRMPLENATRVHDHADSITFPQSEPGPDLRRPTGRGIDDGPARAADPWPAPFAGPASAPARQPHRLGGTRASERCGAPAAGPAGSMSQSPEVVTVRSPGRRRPPGPGPPSRGSNPARSSGVRNERAHPRRR